MPWGSSGQSRTPSGVRTVILVVAGVVIVGLIWAAISLFTSFDQQIATSRAASDQVVAAVLADWGRATFDPLATPAFVTAHGNGQYVDDRYRQLLGAMKTAKPCVMDGMEIVNWSGWSRWRCPAVFENGEATLVINLALSGGQWRLSDFAVQI
jgi:hypothetical protein